MKLVTIMIGLIAIWLYKYNQQYKFEKLIKSITPINNINNIDLKNIDKLINVVPHNNKEINYKSIIIKEYQLDIQKHIKLGEQIIIFYKILFQYDNANEIKNQLSKLGIFNYPENIWDLDNIKYYTSENKNKYIQYELQYNYAKNTKPIRKELNEKFLLVCTKLCNNKSIIVEKIKNLEPKKVTNE